MEGNHAVHCEALKSNPQLSACISLPASSLVVCWQEGEEEGAGRDSVLIHHSHS